jgi:tetratricopeptide (TPR) repeat protein
VGVHEIVFNILGKRGSKKEAFEEALTLIRLVPKRTEPYQFVFEYLKDKRDYGMIIKVMEKGLKAGAKDAFLRECLLLAYLETGKEKPAMQQIKEILKIRPKDISLWLHLANLQEKHGDLGGALTSYKQVLDLSPEHEVAGEAYLRLRLRGVHGQGSQ